MDNYLEEIKQNDSLNKVHKILNDCRKVYVKTTYSNHNAGYYIYFIDNETNDMILNIASYAPSHVFISNKYYDMIRTFWCDNSSFHFNDILIPTLNRCGIYNLIDVHTIPAQNFDIVFKKYDSIMIKELKTLDVNEILLQMK